MARNIQKIECPYCGYKVEAFSRYCNSCGASLAPRQKKERKVPEPIPLPSGKWRIQLRKEGINIVRDSPEECRSDALAARRQWQADEAAGLHEAEFKTTLYKVLDDYISAKKHVCSPSTIRGYEIVRDHRFPAYMKQDVNLIDWQEAINAEVVRGQSPKTIYNSWGVVSASLNYYGIAHSIPTLPRRIPKEKDWLTYEQIDVFLKAVKGKDCELGALLALHSLRRSEIFGLKPSDYSPTENAIYVRGAVLATSDGWQYTDTNKTQESRRKVPIFIPRLKELLDQVDPNAEFVFPVRNLYRDVNAVCVAAGLPKVGVHGLRHSFASLAYHHNWKKMSTQKVGGWVNSRVLDSVYTHNADLDKDVETLREHFRE